MKFSSALTMTTVLSILSTSHGAPVLSIKESHSPAPAHFRRASTVSELADRQYSGNDILDSLNYAYEPGNTIKTLLNFVKRQLGSTDSGVNASGTTSGSGSSFSSTGSEPQQTGHSEPANNGGAGLMGGGVGSTAQDAGFAFEPGEGIKAT